MNLCGRIVAGVGRVPVGVWMMLVLAGLVVTVLTLSTARRRMRRAGERAADSRLVAGGVARGRDTALTVASMIPAALFWAMVLAGSLHGLVAFGRSALGWHAGCAERWVRMVRSECLDWTLIWNQRQLHRVLTEYLRHYNTARPHRGLDLQPPRPALG
jgi:hypothetical protein